MSSISIKQLPQVNEINSEDLLLIQTPTASNTLEFKDLIIGLENTTFANTISTFNTEIEAISANVLTLSSSDITNTADIASNTTNLAASAARVDINTANIATNTAAINSSIAAIAVNTANIATNTTDIATNTTFRGQFATGAPIADATLAPTHFITFTDNAGNAYKILLQS